MSIFNRSEGAGPRRRQAAQRLCRAVAPAMVVAALAACSGSDAAEPARTSVSRAAGAGDAHPCAWPTRADRSIDNIAYPDTAAPYWGQGYRLAEGATLELEGTFPDARYASFITYRTTGGAIDTLTDRDIAPDDGSTNPFAGGSVEGPHAYTVTVRPDRGSDATGNELGADTAEDGPAPDPVPLTAEAEALARRHQAGSGGIAPVTQS